MRSSHVLDRMAVTFDDEHAVAAAGLVLPATLAVRLGIEALADELAPYSAPLNGQAPPCEGVTELMPRASRMAC